ncbi:hypothetical protein COMA2_30158 [Candidatus Nitrospira nitrificans]|uniref:Uncharacterized protein n=1 Tax=Candidatus Nitrospira nitrificans TaxID=1742973 RepID=A0A0S4LIC9_9BACT|nr:hypothetical protein COMA2_30158 [Candidatus Nitrospira nitrificans]
MPLSSFSSVLSALAYVPIASVIYYEPDRHRVTHSPRRKFARPDDHQRRILAYDRRLPVYTGMCSPGISARRSQISRSMVSHSKKRPQFSAIQMLWTGRIPLTHCTNFAASA